MANVVLGLHALVVLFNVGGLMMIAIGGSLGWAWVRRRRFRVAHIVLMAFVTAEAIFGVTCPLTLLEDWLRGVANEQSFVLRWVAALIYWHAPPWVFVLLYVGFLSVVVVAWFVWPPAAKLKQTARG